MSRIFVRREFTFDGQSIEIRLFQPKPDRGDFVCKYEIDLPDGVRASQAYGVDQVQALLLAMQKAHVELLVMRNKHGHSVQWLEDDNLGLPIASVVEDLAPHNRF